MLWYKVLRNCSYMYSESFNSLNFYLIFFCKLCICVCIFFFKKVEVKVVLVFFFLLIISIFYLVVFVERGIFEGDMF